MPITLGVVQELKPTITNKCPNNECSITKKDNKNSVL